MHTSDDLNHASTLLGSLLGVAVLGALLTWSVGAVREVRRRRQADRAVDRSAPVAPRLPQAELAPDMTADLAP